MKPVNQSGTFCPLMRGKCSEHCHDCEFWQPMYHTDSTTGAEQRVFNCAFVWNMQITGMTNARLDGVQKATESMRNEFHGFRGSINTLIRALFAANRQPEPNPQRQAMKEIEGG